MCMVSGRLHSSRNRSQKHSLPHGDRFSSGQMLVAHLRLPQRFATAFAYCQEIKKPKKKDVRFATLSDVATLPFRCHEKLRLCCCSFLISKQEKLNGFFLSFLSLPLPFAFKAHLRCKKSEACFSFSLSLILPPPIPSQTPS